MQKSGVGATFFQVVPCQTLKKALCSICSSSLFLGGNGNRKRRTIPPFSGPSYPPQKENLGQPAKIDIHAEDDASRQSGRIQFSPLSFFVNGPLHFPYRNGRRKRSVHFCGEKSTLCYSLLRIAAMTHIRTVYDNVCILHLISDVGIGTYSFVWGGHTCQR